MVTQKILDRVLKKGIGSAMESVIQEWVMVDLGVDEISNGESLKEEEDGVMQSEYGGRDTNQGTQAASVSWRRNQCCSKPFSLFATAREN